MEKTTDPPPPRQAEAKRKKEESPRRRRQDKSEKRKIRRHPVYFSFFLGRSWLVCPHFFLRQFLARGGSRA